MMSKKYFTLQKLRDLLRYHQKLGYVSLPKTKDIQNFLGSTIERENKDVPPPSIDGGKMPSPIQQTKFHGTIDEIDAEVRGCKGCNLFQKRVLPVPGSGGDRVRIFIVGGWLSVQQQPPVQSLIFGEEEDRMLQRMLTAIGLSQDDAFISNVIKCGIDESVQPKAENISACLSYLHRQISASSPDVICAMGITAARSLIHISQPLSQLRGRFHQYKVDERRTIPIMATYHPTFLLHNPEMKKATWNDLQAIAKELHKGSESFIS